MRSEAFVLDRVVMEHFPLPDGAARVNSSEDRGQVKAPVRQAQAPLRTSSSVVVVVFFLSFNLSFFSFFLLFLLLPFLLLVLLIFLFSPFSSFSSSSFSWSQKFCYPLIHPSVFFLKKNTNRNKRQRSFFYYCTRIPYINILVRHIHSDL